MKKKRMGRPEKKIDWKLFEQLCLIQCTHSEIASFFHIVKDTLYDRAEKKYKETFSTIYKRYSEGGHSSLRRTQFRLAEKNAAMAIWLGKQYLGQRDREHDESKQTLEVRVVDYSRTAIDEQKSDHLTLQLQT